MISNITMIQQTRFYVIFRDITLIIFTSKLLLLCFSWINEACFPFLLQNFSSLLFILPSKPKKSTSYNLFICFSKLENTKNTVQLSRIFGVMSSRTCNYIPMCCWRVPWLKSNSLSQRRKNWSETKTSSLGNKAIIYKLPQYYQNFSLQNAYRTEKFSLVNFFQFF